MRFLPYRLYGLFLCVAPKVRIQNRSQGIDPARVRQCLSRFSLLLLNLPFFSLANELAINSQRQADGEEVTHFHQTKHRPAQTQSEDSSNWREETVPGHVQVPTIPNNIQIPEVYEQCCHVACIDVRANCQVEVINLAIIATIKGSKVSPCVLTIASTPVPEYVARLSCLSRTLFRSRREDKCSPFQSLWRY